MGILPMGLFTGGTPVPQQRGSDELSRSVARRLDDGESPREGFNSRTRSANRKEKTQWLIFQLSISTSR